MTTSGILVNTMRASGVDVVFGLPGDGPAVTEATVDSA